MKKIAIFASGTGSNAENLARAFADDLQICVDSLFCDRENAPVVEKMHRYGVPVFYFPKEVWRGDCKEIVELLQDRGVDLIVLAGFTSFVADCIVQAFDRRIINLHPSLLPAFKGKDAIKQAFDAKAKKCGCTVHFVSDELDGGKIISQKEVEIFPGDTLETLEARVHEAEHILLPSVIADIASGKIKLG